MTIEDRTTVLPGHVALLLDPQVFAYYTGLVYRGVALKRQEDSWRLIFYAERIDGTPVYAFFAATVLQDAVEVACRAILSKDGRRYWHPDKYAK